MDDGWIDRDDAVDYEDYGDRAQNSPHLPRPPALRPIRPRRRSLRCRRPPSGARGEPFGGAEPAVDEFRGRIPGRNSEDTILISHLPRPPALGPVRPRRCGLGGRGDAARAARQFVHPSLGAKNAVHETEGGLLTHGNDLSYVTDNVSR